MVDYSRVGRYAVTYSCPDADGQTATAVQSDHNGQSTGHHPAWILVGDHHHGISLSGHRRRLLRLQPRRSQHPPTGTRHKSGSPGRGGVPMISTGLGPLESNIQRIRGSPPMHPSRKEDPCTPGARSPRRGRTAATSRRASRTRCVPSAYQGRPERWHLLHMRLQMSLLPRRRGPCCTPPTIWTDCS